MKQWKVYFKKLLYEANFKGERDVKGIIETQKL